MANGKVTQSEADVQRLLCDTEAMRQMVEEEVQKGCASLLLYSRIPSDWRRG